MQQQQQQKKGLIPENNIEPVSALLVERQTMGQPCSLICRGLLLRVSIRGPPDFPWDPSPTWRCLINESGKHTNTRARRHARTEDAARRLLAYPRLLVKDLDPTEGNGQEHLLLVLPL